MPVYTYGYYFYLNNSIDATKEHHNKLILHQEPDIYITSVSNFMYETLPFLPKLFINKMVKK